MQRAIHSFIVLFSCQNPKRVSVAYIYNRCISIYCIELSVAWRMYRDIDVALYVVDFCSFLLARHEYKHDHVILVEGGTVLSM
jgi:hypothetical protein